MISIVVPVYNEKESLNAFYQELLQELKKLNAPSYEIIFVDDGSQDTSLEHLKKIATKDSHVRIFSFRKNLGKAESLTYGFQKAKGDFIVTLDADLQDQPCEIGNLLKKNKEGWDVVCGWRKNRKDKKRMIFISKLFNFFTGRAFGLRLHDYNCGLKSYTKDAAKSLHLYGGLHRFIPLIVFQEGFTITEIPVIHEKRQFGKSKYGFSKLFKDIPDMFTMLFLIRYSKKPLHFFGMAGGLALLIGIAILIYLSIAHFMGQAIGTRPLLFFGMLLVLSGFQLFFTGFLADLLINITQKKSGAEDLPMAQLKFVLDR